MGTLTTTAQDMKPGDMLLAINGTREQYGKVVLEEPHNWLGSNDIHRLEFVGYWGTRPWLVLDNEETVTVMRPETIRERARIYSWLAKEFGLLIGTGHEWKKDGRAIAEMMHYMEYGRAAEDLDEYTLRVIRRYDRYAAIYGPCCAN